VAFPSILELKPDIGTTNVRNTAWSHWKPWLAPASRCLVPFTAFSEPGRDAEGRYRPVWFRLTGDDPEPVAFFSGVHVPTGPVCAKSRPARRPVTSSPS
jgi:putative SOS response-associated peptidase YedK